MIKHKYKKHYKKDGSFYLKEYRVNGKIRNIGEDNSSYIEFLKEGGVVEIVDYVPSTPLTKEQLINRLKPQIEQKYYNLIYADFEYKTIIFAGDKESIELLKESEQLFSIMGYTPIGFEWWGVNDKRLPVNLTDIQNMIIQQGINKENNLVQSKDDKDSLQDMTVEQLLAYEV